MMAVGTMKRKLKWTAVVLAVSLLGFATAIFLWSRDRITAESWKQIQIGMSEKEVEEILGGPGKRQCPPGLVRQLSEPHDISLFDRFISKYWTSQRGCIQVNFDLRGNVCEKAFGRSGEPNFIDRLRDWLGW
jgi:hypothetical protein